MGKLWLCCWSSAVALSGKAEPPSQCYRGVLVSATAALNQQACPADPKQNAVVPPTLNRQACPPDPKPDAEVPPTLNQQACIRPIPVRLGMFGYGWLWLAMVGQAWLWLAMAGYGMVCSDMTLSEECWGKV